MLKIIRRLVSDDSGATAIEYGLIAVLIACALLVGAGAVGTNINAVFNTIKTTIAGS